MYEDVFDKNAEPFKSSRSGEILTNIIKIDIENVIKKETQHYKIEIEVEPKSEEPTYHVYKEDINNIYEYKRSCCFRDTLIDMIKYFNK